MAEDRGMRHACERLRGPWGNARRPRRRAPSVITLMTYNIANGLAEPAPLVRLLRGSGADVIALQELAPAQADAIAAELAGDYPFMRLHPLGIPGKGVLSRFPIDAAGLLELFPYRPDLAVTLDVQGVPLRVISAHPPPPRFRRGGLGPTEATLTQIAGLIQEAHRGGPTVLMGDFNLPSRHPVCRQIARSGLVDAFHAVGRGIGQTLPKRMARWAYAGSPFGSIPLPAMLRVDYVWHTRHLRALDSWVGGHAGSDHLPVFARLAFEP